MVLGLDLREGDEIKCRHDGIKRRKATRIDEMEKKENTAHTFGDILQTLVVRSHDCDCCVGGDHRRKTVIGNSSGVEW